MLLLVAFSDAGQFQVQVSHAASGQQMRNTFGLYAHDSTDPITTDVLAAFLSSTWMDSFITAYKAIIPSSYTLDAILARRAFDPQDPTSVPPESFRNVSAAGTLSGSDANLPLGAALLIHMATDSAVRSGHGRVFLPSPTVAAFLSAGHWATTGTYWTNVAALITQLNALLYTAGGSHAGGGAADFDLAVYSKTRRAAGISTYLFRCTALTPQSKVRWLRSRVPAV
jgi:hypothetical protein